MWGGCDSSPCLGLGQVEGPRRKHRDEVSPWRLLEDERGLQGKRGIASHGEAASTLYASSQAPGVKSAGVFHGGKSSGAGVAPGRGMLEMGKPWDGWGLL